MNSSAAAAAAVSSRALAHLLLLVNQVLRMCYRREGTFVYGHSPNRLVFGGQFMHRSSEHDAASLQTRRDAVHQETLQILLVDAYDSYSNNIKSLLHESRSRESPMLGVSITDIKMDDSRFPLHDYSSLHEFLKGFDGVVVGPGPGNPAVESDIGLIPALWGLPKEHLKPVLGVCLGFQSMCLSAGAKVERLRNPRHGKTSNICHSSTSIFAGLGECHATHYHSLHVDIDHPLQLQDLSDDHEGIRFAEQLWQPSKTCPSIVPIAWDCTDHANGPVLMGAHIADKPFCGVQFHPEGVSSNMESKKILSIWLDHVVMWKRAKSSLAPAVDPDDGHVTQPGARKRARPDSEDQEQGQKRVRLDSTDSTDSPPALTHATQNSQILRWDDDSSYSMDDAYEGGGPTPAPILQMPVRFGEFSFCQHVYWRKILLNDWLREDTISRLFEVLLHKYGDERLVFESGTRSDGSPVQHETGRYTIIPLVEEEDRVDYSYTELYQQMKVTRGRNCVHTEKTSDPLGFLKEAQKSFGTVQGPNKLPFWGGLVGYINYEACVGLLGVKTDLLKKPKKCVLERPDVRFTMVLRSIVIDHKHRYTWVMSVKPDDAKWVEVMAVRIRKFEPEEEHLEAEIGRHDRARLAISRIYLNNPKREDYMDKVSKCQEHIRAGDSYELCLTDVTNVAVVQRALTPDQSWAIWRNIMRVNPAPFGAYLRYRGTAGVSGLTIVGASPERFLSWSRDGRCEFRPIKGTLAKKPGMNLAAAKLFFKENQKERSELLMITDLIRHDLHGVLGPEAWRVVVKKLCAVEEYATLFQQVSVIRGNFEGTGKMGVDILAGSLPPGSMTGAPKKRSCELLQEIEGRRQRGLYSGVLGYFDIGGGGDFSVVIRTATRWDSATKKQRREDGEWVTHDHYLINAGGAVTAGSTAEAEYLEMRTKVDGVSRGFSFVDMSGLWSEPEPGLGSEPDSRSGSESDSL